MKHEWKVGPNYVIHDYKNEQMIVGSNPGGTGHTDNAASMSYESFKSELVERPERFSMYSEEQRAEMLELVKVKLGNN